MAKSRVPLRSVRSLTQTERQELAANWAVIACRHCGFGHGGLCPRVRRVETQRLPNGSITERWWYWPEGKWSLPADAIAPADVFPGGVPTTEPIEAVAREKRKHGSR